MAVKEFYEAIEVDPADVLKRFGGSEAMLEKFLKKFLADGTFAQLSEAVAAGDQELTFRAAHTLKGLAGNFDLLKLQSLAAKIVERYKTQNTWKADTVFEEESFLLLENILEEGGELPARVPYEDLVTTEFSKKAAK